MQPTLKQWLDRKPSGPKPKKPMRRATRVKRVNPKRAKENAEYTRRRKAFLEAHPHCMALDKIVDFMLNYAPAWEHMPMQPQRSTEIHHMRKPKCKYLNDESTWLAVCEWSHRWIEDHKNIARQIGLLH